MPEFKEFPRVRVASVIRTGPFDQSIPGGMARLAEWAEANGIEPLGSPLSIFLDDPGQVPIDQVRTQVCIPVGPEVDESDEVQIQEIGGYEVATSIYNDPADMGRAYDELYSWIEQEGYHDAGAPMEVYLNLEEFTAEIAVPVAREEILIVETVEVESAPLKRATAKKATKKTAKKTAKKTVKKSAKKATKKTARKTTSKKAARKRSNQ